MKSVFIALTGLIFTANAAFALPVVSQSNCISMETDTYVGFYTIINKQDASKDRMASLPPITTYKCLQWAKEGGK